MQEFAGKITRYLIGAGAGALLLMAVATYFVGADLWSFVERRRGDSIAELLQPTSMMAKAGKKRVPCPEGGLIVPDYTPKQVKKLEKDYRLPEPWPGYDPAKHAAKGSAEPGEQWELLGAPGEPVREFKLFDGPNDEKVQVKRILLGEHDVPKAPWGGKILGYLDDGQYSVSLLRNKRPFIDMKQRFGMGGSFGKDDVDTRWSAYGFWQPAKILDFTPKARGGFESARGESGWFVDLNLEYEIPTGD